MAYHGFSLTNIVGSNRQYPRILKILDKSVLWIFFNCEVKEIVIRNGRAAGIQRGSAKNLQTIVGSVTKAQIREIAQVKLPDLNTNDIDDAIRSIEGSARSMGIEIK